MQIVSWGTGFFFKRGEGERGNARFFTTTALDLVHKLPALGPYVN